MNKILILSAVALTMTAVSNAKAGEPLLSPHAKGNQINGVMGTTNEVTVNYLVSSGGALLSPRAQGNQIVRVAGTNNDPDLVAAAQGLTGSPKDKSQQPVQVYQIAPVK